MLLISLRLFKVKVKASYYWVNSVDTPYLDCHQDTPNNDQVIGQMLTIPKRLQFLEQPTIKQSSIIQKHTYK